MPAGNLEPVTCLKAALGSFRAKALIFESLEASLITFLIESWISSFAMLFAFQVDGFLLIDRGRTQAQERFQPEVILLYDSAANSAISSRLGYNSLKGPFSKTILPFPNDEGRLSQSNGPPGSGDLSEKPQVAVLSAF